MVLPKFGNSNEAVNRLSSRIFSSTAVTKFCGMTDGRSERGSSWIFSRLFLEALTHLRSLLSLILMGSLTLIICRRLSADETFLIIKKQITECISQSVVR